MEAQTTRDRVRAAVDDGARFYVSHSGGKDSQACYAIVREVVPDEQIAVVHADMGRHEWTGIEEHIRANIAHPLHVVRASKTFSEMVRHRAKTRPDVPSFPSASQRQCTSDLKRGPIYKFIRGHMNEHKTVLGINCIGLRAEESPSRRSRQDWQINRTLSNRKRTVYDWLPVQRLLRAEVFERIRKAGQEPFHAYAEGNDRVSCVFCIFGCPADVANGRRARPELYEEYTSLEQETGWTMFPTQSLAQRCDAGDAEREAEKNPAQGRLCW